MIAFLLIILCSHFSFSLEQQINEDLSPLYVQVSPALFQLYTRGNTENPYNLIIDDVARLQSSNFVNSAKTFFIIHGWLGSTYTTRVLSLKDAYIQKYDFNVIVVDWRNASDAKYKYARNAIAGVAQDLSYFINFLINRGHSTNLMHLVGHSLGAHIAGLAARKSTGGLIESIIGLDPAKVLFDFNNVDGRLNTNDAKYVEVIHTNDYLSAFLQPLGHTDFYANGGVLQPECFLQFVSCPHLRSMDILERTIRINDLVGYQCKDLNKAKNGNCPRDGVTLKPGGNLPKPWTPGLYWFSTK